MPGLEDEEQETRWRVEHREALEAWLDAVPEGPYDPCPCGCGKKWRFVLKETEQELAAHERRFVENWRARNEIHSNDCQQSASPVDGHRQ